MLFSSRICVALHIIHHFLLVFISAEFPISNEKINLWTKLQSSFSLKQGSSTNLTHKNDFSFDIGKSAIINTTKKWCMMFKAEKMLQHWR